MDNSKPHIMIIEDSPTQAEILRRILELEKYRVTIACNGAEGLTMVRETKPALVISDINMPEMTGCEMCKKIKDDRELKNIPVILLTVLSNPDEIIRGLHSSADFYLTKPYNKEYLLSTVKSLLAGKKMLQVIKKENFLEVNVSGKAYEIKPDGEQILNFLFSLYETSIQHNVELQRTNEQLRQEIAARKQAENELNLSSLYKEVVNTLLTIALRDISLDDQLGTTLNRLITIPFLSTIPMGAIFVVENEKVLKMRVSVGIPGIVVNKCKTVQFGECMCGKAAISGNIEFSHCQDSFHTKSWHTIGPHSHYVVPITLMGRILGILLLFLKPGHKEDMKEHMLLKSVAKTLAVMIERKRVEEETKEMQVKMLSSSKMATLGEIATGIAHEINQPLTYISGFLQGLKEDIKNDELELMEISQQLNISLQQISRIVKVIQHLRTFGRDDLVVNESVDLGNVLHNTLILMGERIRLKNIKLTSNVQNNIAYVNGNMNQLEQVFINLFQNAMDSFTGEQLHPEIKVEISPNEERTHMLINIEDNGEGIKQEHMDRIFEPFYTTKEVGKGTGLGLSIVYGIIESHKGAIKCASKEKEGTLFTIELPLL